MARQWDTKREFKPDYRRCAQIVFAGWLTVLRHPDWRATFRRLWDELYDLGVLIVALLAGLAMLTFSPVVFPAFCLREMHIQRRNRLYWLKRNRAADEDI